MSSTEETTLLSHLYSEMYPIPPPQQGEAKHRRRRKKANVAGGEARKRKLTQEQINVLELNFKDEHKLETEKKDRLAMELGLEPRQVAVWFQNRRARYKSQKMEDEYSQLKAQHDTVVAQKCLLELEILKLREKISDAEKVAQNLIAERIVFNGCALSNSPSSPINFATGELNMFYVPEYDYSYIHGSDGWVNLFDS